jgi:hypothetical protein
MMVGMGRLRGLGLGVWLVAAAGCFGGESLGGSRPSGTGGTGATGSTAAAGGSFATGGGGVNGTGGDLGAGGTGMAGSFCGEYDVAVFQPLRPDILLLVDRSSSMNDDSNEMSCTGGCGATSKWALLSAEINRLVTEYQSVNWGLALFGSDDACGVSASVAVDVAQDAASSIALALAATTPGGDAPTAAAILGASAYLQSRLDTNPKYILLATDGRSGCATGAAGADIDAENAVATALGSGIPTLVLGLAPTWDTTAIATLNQMAENGGEALQGSANAFATLGSIDMQLSPISSISSTAQNPCVVGLPYPVGPDTSLRISITTGDGQSVAIPEDPLAGWSFTSPYDDAISISASACTGLQSGAYTRITIIYSCDPTWLGDVAP